MDFGTVPPAQGDLASEAGEKMTMDDSKAMERRLVVRLLQYWRGLGDIDRLPRQADIDADVIADMWPNCALLDVTGGKDTDPEILFIGTDLTVRAGAELTGKMLSSAAADTLVSKGFSYFGQVLAKKVPITFGGEFKDVRGVKILYRSIILPLTKDGTDITALLAAANCREVAQD